MQAGWFSSLRALTLAVYFGSKENLIYNISFSGFIKHEVECTKEDLYGWLWFRELVLSETKCEKRF